MPLDDRKKAFDNISRVFAVTRFDIEQHQEVSDYSLNIHGEYFYRDVINEILDANYENTNFHTKNAPSVDLIDESHLKAIQITTTTTPKKIEKTLKGLKSEKLKNYTIYLFYLLKKPRLKKETKESIESKYSIDLDATLYDSGDILRKLVNLPTDRIIELNKRYFEKISDKYTDKIVLDLVIKHLLKGKQNVVKNYDDYFGSLETNEKIKLNNINIRISAKINEGLDYKSILKKLSKEDNVIEELRTVVINEYYKDCLIEAMNYDKNSSELEKLSTRELHEMACSRGLDFNKIISNVERSIEADIEIKDFNAMNICWIIISFFFELCDIGRHNNVVTK